MALKRVQCVFPDSNDRDYGVDGGSCSDHGLPVFTDDEHDDEESAEGVDVVMYSEKRVLRADRLRRALLLEATFTEQAL